MTMFSRTVSSMSSVSCCGTTPRRPRIFEPSRAGSIPRTRRVPSVTGETQPIMRIVDVFPAPLGPRKPNASPRWRSKSIPSTATKSPNRFTRSRAWMSGWPLCAVTQPTLAIESRPTGTRRRLDVAGDLLDERCLGLEHRLVAQALPQLHHEAPSVEIAVEVEEEWLDAALRSAVVRVRPDGDGGAVVEREAGVDPVLGAGEVRLQAEVRGRIAECPSALIAGDDHAVELERPAEHRRGRLHVALGQRSSYRRGRDPGHLGHHEHLVAEAPEQREVPRPANAEAEVLAGDHDFHSGGAEIPLGELLGLEALQLGREGGDQHVRHTCIVDELEAPVERGQQLDLVAESNAGMWVERDDGRLEFRRMYGIEDGSVPAMDAVEAPDRDRAPPTLELRGISDDVHPSLARASSGGMIRSGSASST